MPSLHPHYPDNGRPSIDPELMIRMLIIGYVFAIRSERALCRDVQVNLAYPVGSVDFQSRTRSLIILRSRAPAMCGSVTVTFSAVSSSMSWKRALQQDWSAAKSLRSHETGSMWVGRWLKVCFTLQTACVRMVRTGPLSTQKNPSYLRAVD